MIAAWAEDRAMLGSNPSADPGPHTEAGAARDCPGNRIPSRERHQSDKPMPRGAASLGLTTSSRLPRVCSLTEVRNPHFNSVPVCLISTEAVH